MDRFSLQDLQQLIEARPDVALSLYLPTYRTGPDVRQNTTRLKNVLKQAEDRLAERGWSRGDAKAMLAQGRQIQAEAPLWTQPGDGMAIYVAPGLFRFYRLPIHFDEQVVAGRAFHLAPVLPMLESDGTFYLLAVSQNAVRLMLASHYRVDELHPDSLPHDLRSALNVDEFQSSLQHHRSGESISTEHRHGYGDRPTVGINIMFHGQGGSGQEVYKRDEILQFFHRIDHGLQAFMQDDRRPLVFAGVDYLFPIFREACGYRGLVEKPVEGNTDHLSAEQLHGEAWKVVQPIFERHREETLAKFGDLQPRRRATTDLHQTTIASRHGQVDTLLVAKGRHAWGRVDEQTDQVQLDDGPQVGNEDLLNYAALRTIVNRGHVYTLPAERMPAAGPVAALLRYPAPAGT